MRRLLHVVPPPSAPATAEDGDQGDEARAKSDERLVAALRAGEASAADRLVERYGPMVRRILFRVFGTDDSEQADLAQEIFTRAWQGIGQLSEARALKAWLTRIAVFTARGAIRYRQRRRWLSFLDVVPEPDPTPSWAGPEMREAAGCVYRIFDRIPVDERLPYALRSSAAWTSRRRRTPAGPRCRRRGGASRGPSAASSSWRGSTRRSAPG